MKKCLNEVLKYGGPFSPRDLYPYQLALYQIDQMRKDGKFVGVRSGSETVKAKQVIGDPSYFTSRVEETGKVIRAICFLKHPIPGTEDADSCQIIIPQNQVNRRNGMSR